MINNDLRKIRNKIYPGRTESPMFVSDAQKIRIGAIAFDKDYFVSTSDGRLFGNFYEIYLTKMNPVIGKIENRLRHAEKEGKIKDIDFYQYKLNYIKHMRELEKINFFDFIIQDLFSSYDIIITESIESLQSTGGNYSPRGNDYPGKHIITKPYFKEFVVGLMMYASNKNLNKMVIPASLQIFSKAHNTCHSCNTHHQNPRFNRSSQWLCDKCGYMNFEGVNSAINLRYLYFDAVMAEAGLPITLKDTIDKGANNNENRG